MVALRSCFIAAAVRSVIAGQDVGMELLYTTSSGEVTNECYTVPELPTDLQGTFSINGPSYYEFKVKDSDVVERFNQVNDGYGKFQKFVFGDGKICYTTKPMPTGMWNNSWSEGRVTAGMLLQETQPSRRKCMGMLNSGMCDMMAPNDNTFVNIIDNGAHYTMLTDTMTALDVDLDTLTVIGKHKYNMNFVKSFHMAALSSAHPWPVADGHITILSETPMGIPLTDQQVYYDFVKTTYASGSTNVELLARIKVTHAFYEHSFGITQDEKYAVFPMNLVMTPPSPFDHRADVVDRFVSGVFDGVAVVDLSAGMQEPRIFKTEPFYHLHTANCLMTNDSIITDLTKFQYNMFTNSSAARIDMAMKKELRDKDENKAIVTRLETFISGPKAGQATFRSLSNPKRHFDFVKVNPAYLSKPYCFIYGSEWWHDEESYFSMAIGKINLCTSDAQPPMTYWHRENWYPSEPSFVSKGTADKEDDGYLVFTALNGEEQKSYIVVVDASTMQEISATPLSVRITYTAHGNFFKARKPKVSTSNAESITVSV